MRYLVIVLAFAALRCAHANAGGGAEPAVHLMSPDELPPECGEAMAIARSGTSLTYVERDTIDLLSAACRGAVRERDGLGGGACANMLGQFADERKEALHQAERAAAARERGDADQAGVFSAKIRSIRTAAEAQGAAACASREPDFPATLRR